MPDENKNEFRPDWTLNSVDRLSISLSIALHKHIPDWPGATDEQLAAVAREIIEFESD